MMKVASFILVALISISFNLNAKTFELIGKVSSIQGFPIPNTTIKIKENNRVIGQTRTNNFGEYKLLIRKTGTFKLIAGEHNKFFHPMEIEAFKFNELNQFTQNFTLSIDKQVLQEECARLRESYRHMIHNSKNLSYKRAFINRFPKNGVEMELFFSSLVHEVNLKKEAKRYIQTVFKNNFTGRNTYIVLFIRFSQRTDMRIAGKNTKKFYDYSIPVINANKEILYKELENTDEKYTLKFFLWMFSGGAYVSKKMIPSFDYLAEKYPKVYSLMTKSFETYRQED
jgi:hypothetical protein